mgnify:CR=1 FL=1
MFLNDRTAIVQLLIHHQTIAKKENTQIPDNKKADLDIRPVKWIDEVLDIALKYQPKPLEDEPDEPASTEKKSAKSASEQINTH